MNDIYQDIARRTGGCIYVGVVGPVRTGKSTFIKRMMETMVIPNIGDDAIRQRAVDELPQSAAGKMIMTTEPKFIPEEPVEVLLDGGSHFKVRMVDSVGFVVQSSIGYTDGEGSRLVDSPWSDTPMPFEKAAEIGTEKVIQEHATVGVVVTTDGSICEIPREDYAEAETRVIKELKELGKPFVVILNSAHPGDERTLHLRDYLQERHQVPVLPLNCLELSAADITGVLKGLLHEFPVKEISIQMPRWINTLEKDHWLKSAVFGKITELFGEVDRISQIDETAQKLYDCPQISNVNVKSIDLGTGAASLNIGLESDLFYKIIAENTGLDLNDESDLMPCIVSLAKAKAEYDKIKDAMAEVEATGYGIVMPTIDELSLEEPEIVKQGGRYGVRLKASAPSIHMMKANITTEVSPIVGSEKQSEELVMYLLKEFEESPGKIWESNIFGKSLHDLVNEGLHNKLYRMPMDARTKIQETVERVINEGCSGLLCIII